MTTIPRAASEFTPEWLTNVLRAGGHITNASVAAVATSSLGEGFGLLGSLTRLSLSYDRHEPGAPRSVVAKFPAIAEMNLGLARQYRVYEREHRFYADVASRIETRVPKCYFSHFEAETNDAVILLAPKRAKDDVLRRALMPLVGAIGVEKMREANLMVDRDEGKATPKDAAAVLAAGLRH